MTTEVSLEVTPGEAVRTMLDIGVAVVPGLFDPNDADLRAVHQQIQDVPWEWRDYRGDLRHLLVGQRNFYNTPPEYVSGGGGSIAKKRVTQNIIGYVNGGFDELGFMNVWKPTAVHGAQFARNTNTGWHYDAVDNIDPYNHEQLQLIAALVLDGDGRTYAGNRHGRPFHRIGSRVVESAVGDLVLYRAMSVNKRLGRELDIKPSKRGVLHNVKAGSQGRQILSVG